MADREGSKRIEEKHSLAIRWLHWLHFPILFTMIWSGILIYWADSRPGQGAGHFYGTWLFPDWIYTNALYRWDHRLAEGMAWHFLFMWLFAANGLAYVLFLTISGQWRSLWPRRAALREAWEVILHGLRIRREAPTPLKYNAAQQMAYLGVILMGAGSLATGLAIYKPTQLSWPKGLGGYEVARWLHFWLTIGLLVFFAIHVVQVVRAGWNNFRSMITGKEVTERV